MRFIYKAAFAASTFALAAFAQDEAQVKNQDEMQVKKMMVELQQMASAKAAGGALMPMAGIMTVVKNAPYSADQISENTLVLADGTRIHTESKVTISRDSQGRVRQESPDRISIWDPVENVTYVLNPKAKSIMQSRVVSRFADGNADLNKRFFYSSSDSVLPGVPFSKGGADLAVIVSDGGIMNSTAEADLKAAKDLKLAQAADKAKLRAAKADLEPLGTQRMEGISADGTRETNTIEAGAIGNDRPINIVSERWYSPELQTEMMTLHRDPRTGEQITRLTNVRLGEPDATLFQVPAGYQKPGEMPPVPRK